MASRSSLIAAAARAATTAAHDVTAAITVPATAVPMSLTSATSTPTGFQPRQVFDGASTNLPASYFLGHHRAALDRMRRTLAGVGLVIECRDVRVPLTGWNPLLERTLSVHGGGGDSLARIIVYTKRDLAPPPDSADWRTLASRLRHLHRSSSGGGAPAAVLFLGQGEPGSTGADRATRTLLAAIKDVALAHRAAGSLTGLRALVVGMPNAGKSTLLNRLRAAGIRSSGAKVARTGAQPGVTRKLGTPVRVVAPEADDEASGVYVIDTPGVFVPHVADPEAMLKLALVGGVKDGLLPPVALADYLLFRVNLADPALYGARWRGVAPTNDVHAFLDGVARATGKLGAGGVPSREAAAQAVVQAWRRGELGRFVLDDVGSAAAAVEAANKKMAVAEGGMVTSMNQARRRAKEERKARGLAKLQAKQGGGGRPP